MVRKRCYAVTWISKSKKKLIVRHNEIRVTTMKGAMTQIGKQPEMVEILEIKMVTGVAGAKTYSFSIITQAIADLPTRLEETDFTDFLMLLRIDIITFIEGIVLLEMSSRVFINFIISNGISNRIGDD